jgi:hypothetical protein
VGSVEFSHREMLGFEMQRLKLCLRRSNTGRIRYRDRCLRGSSDWCAYLQGASSLTITLSLPAAGRAELRGMAKHTVIDCVPLAVVRREMI